MSDKSEKEQCGAFLYIIGQAGRDVYNTMTFTNEQKDKIEALFVKFGLSLTRETARMLKY